MPCGNQPIASVVSWATHQKNFARFAWRNALVDCLRHCQSREFHELLQGKSGRRHELFVESCRVDRVEISGAGHYRIARCLRISKGSGKRRRESRGCQKVGPCGKMCRCQSPCAPVDGSLSEEGSSTQEKGHNPTHRFWTNFYNVFPRLVGIYFIFQILISKIE